MNSMVTEEELTKYLAECPLCKSNHGFSISGFLFKKDFQCKSCGAKWRWENSDKVLLREYSENGAGDFLLEVQRPASFWSNLDLEHINWERVPKPESTILHSLVLRKGEGILAGWNGVFRSGELRSTESMPQKGNLVLTTSRLLWLEEKRSGLLKTKTSYHLVYSLMLEDLHQILLSTREYWHDEENVEMTDGQDKKYFYRLTRMQEYPSCKPFIMKAIEERRKEIESERRKERVQLVLDFSSLRDHMEKGGLVMQAFRCPHCSAPVEFPEKGKTTKCAHCGTKIFARDIFEKIKDLIG